MNRRLFLASAIVAPSALQIALKAKEAAGAALPWDGRSDAMVWFDGDETLYSQDGIIWSRVAPIKHPGWEGVTYGNGTFIATPAPSQLPSAPTIPVSPSP